VKIKRLAKELIRDHFTPGQEESLTVGYWRVKNFLSADYEPECRVLSRFIRKGDIVIDLGVNMGQYASRMARLVGPAGRVIGFEALPSTYRLAQRIITHANVELHNVAVSDRRGSVAMSTWIDEGNVINRGMTRVVEDPEAAIANTVTVASELLDEAVQALNQHVTFIKCDIEGHEVPAFRGGMKLLVRDTPVLLVETGGTKFRDLAALLSPLGYRAERLGSNGALETLEGEMTEVANVFFLPPRVQS
jgi:FkbM family methyltransferase